MIGIPQCVTHERLNPEKAHIETMVPEKKAVMEGDTKFTNLIESSIYNNNHIYHISMVPEELKWFIKDNECFNVDAGKVKLIFLFMN